MVERGEVVERGGGGGEGRRCGEGRRRWRGEEAVERGGGSGEGWRWWRGGEGVERGICSSPFLLLLLYAQISVHITFTVTSDLSSIADVSGRESQADLFS